MPEDTTDTLPSRFPDFREDLRSSTSAAHTRLDTALSRFDLSVPTGRRAFSRVQLRGFTRLSDACDDHAAEGTQALRDTLAALTDEASEDVSASVGATKRLHPDAVAYVTLGSQLGTSVLRKGLAEEERNGLFGLTPDKAAWRAFCQRMRDTPPDDATAAQVREDAIRAFDIFYEEFQNELARAGSNPL